jgi:hypothetical protein
MSLENPTIVQATSNTVTVVLNPSLNQIAVVEPQTGSTIVRDSVIRGPSGPSGPLATLNSNNTEIIFNDDGTPLGDQNLTFNVVTNTFTTQQAVFQGAVNVNATLTTHNIIPTVDNVYSIGTVTDRFHDIYLSNSTIYIGDATISSINDTVILSNVETDFISANGANIDGNLYVAGDITLDGNLIIGNVNTDTISVIADFTSNLVPDVTDTYNLGTPEKRWDEIHVNTANVATINLQGNLTATQSSTITVGATTVNTSYISANVLISGPTETTYNVFTTTSSDPITIDSFSSSKFTTVKYIIQSKTVDVYHSTELFCMQDGISSYITEYATLINNYTLGTYSLTISGGICNLIFHPNNPLNNIITVKLVRTAITA